MDNQTPIVQTPESERQKLWKTDEVAAYLNVGVSTIRNWVEKKGLPFLRIGGTVRYDPEAVREWIKRQNGQEAA